MYFQDKKVLGRQLIPVINLFCHEISTTISGSQFNNLDRGVFTIGVANDEELEINKNEFNNIRISGIDLNFETSSIVSNNVFNNVDRACIVQSTGDRANVNEFNEYNNSGNGISAISNNSQFVFRQNCFNNSQITDFNLFGQTIPAWGPAPGVVADQGVAFGLEAGNDFTQPLFNFVITESDQFLYFLHPNSQNTRRHPDHQSNEFFATIVARSTCEEFVPDPHEPSEDCNGEGMLNAETQIDLLQNNINGIESRILQETSEEEKRILESKLKYVQRNLTELKIDRIYHLSNIRRISDLTQMFHDEEFRYKTNIFLVIMDKGQFEYASSYLNSLVPESLEDVDFITIQNINIKWYKDQSYDGTDDEINQLIDIVTKKHRYSGFAHTVYKRLSGETIPSVFVEARSQKGSVLFDSPTNNLKLYPNPSNDKITIEYTGSMTSVKFEIISIDQKVINNTVLNRGDKKTVNLETFNSGIYFARISNMSSGEMISVSKFIKL